MKHAAGRARSVRWRSEAKAFAASFACVAAGCAVLALIASRLATSVEDAAVPGTRSFKQAYAEVFDGMHRDNVLRSLGGPDYESAEFRLGQREGFESAHAEAAASAARRFLFWERGIDTTFAIGLSSDDTVVFKAAGGT